MKKVAIIRGKFLNKYEMQSFEPLAHTYDITGFGSLTPYHDAFVFPVVKLPSPMDLPEFPYKMPVLNRMFVDAHYLFGLEQQLKGFDIAHSAETYFHYTQQALNAKKRGFVKKVIATVLENIPHNNEGIWGRKGFKMRARNELDHIIALTKKTKETLMIEGADEKKITVIGHGIDTKKFMPAAKKEKNMCTILFSGRLEKYKGIFEFLDAAEILLHDKKIRQKLQFIIVGRGGEEKRMHEREKELGIAHFITHKNVPYDTMPLVYQEADIFAAPSKTARTWSEQYCTVLLEAQSCGLPIVTTRSGGIPENVGNAGLYANEGDSISLARQIKRFITGPSLRKQYGRNARERALHVHDIHVIAKKISDVYTHVLPS